MSNIIGEYIYIHTCALIGIQVIITWLCQILIFCLITFSIKEIELFSWH